MSDNPSLKEMGINNPGEIIKYLLRQEGNGDVLKVYYRRQKGSLLPSSRKYKFGRSSKTIMTDSGKQEFEEVYEISPFLRQAISELDEIVQHKEDVIDRKKKLIDEMDHLERVLTSKLDELRREVELL